MSEFQVTVTHTFREGWGVAFMPVYEGEQEDGTESDRISDVIPAVCRIAAETVSVVGDAPCVYVPDLDFYIPVSNFRAEVKDTASDTHDLRERWFPTEKEARDHEACTMQRWRNPQPWESFIELS